MTSDELKKLIETDDRWAIKALITVYYNQEDDEQIIENTVYENGIGFNSSDANFMTSLAKNFLKWGKLSEKQMVYVRRNMMKYAGQAVRSGVEKIGIETADDIVKEEKKFRPPVLEATLKGLNMIIKFSFPIGDTRFQEYLGKVKSLEERRFNSETKKWSAPISLENIEKLREWGFELSQDILDWEKKNQYKDIDLKKIPGLPAGLKPRPYQMEGVEYIESRHGRALIGDEMGLGKTIQALCWLHLHPEARPAIIVCPASLKANWKKEINKWLPGETVHTLSGRWSKNKAIPDDGIIVINYDVVSNKYKKVKDEYTGKTKSVEQKNTGWGDHLAKIKPEFICFDEIQYLKNLKTHRGKACNRLAKKIPYIVGLSGTPIENRPIEFYTPIKIINPTIFPSYWNYAQKYCGATHNGFGWDFTGATNTKELHDKLAKTVMIRRLKKNVLPELPPKNRMVISLEINNRREYDDAASDIISYIRETSGDKAADKASEAEHLVAIEKLKQLAIKGKINACIEWIEGYLENNNKLVVFCVHTKIIEILMEHFGEKAVSIYGKTSLKKRNKNVEAFQEDPKIKLLIGNVKAAGTGLTLTAANATATIELAWKPAEHSQAEDRVHRIGQEADSVFAYYLIAQNTIEEDIAGLLDKKMEVLNQILDGEEVSGGSLLTELIKKLEDKK